MKDYRDVILRPVITEQTASQMDELNKYTFEVPKQVSKLEVADAVEYLFGVKVKKVNIINVKPRTKRFGRNIGKIGGWKKAIVTLEPGSSIDLYSEE